MRFFYYLGSGGSSCLGKAQSQTYVKAQVYQRVGALPIMTGELDEP